MTTTRYGKLSSGQIIALERYERPRHRATALVSFVVGLIAAGVLALLVLV